MEKLKDYLKKQKQLNSTRTLNQCGLIVTHNIGLKGLSPQHACEEMKILMNNYSDDGTVSKNFKFYKEYWLVNQNSYEMIVDCKII